MSSYAIIGGSRGIGLELVRQLSNNSENIVFVTVRNIATSVHLSSFVSQSGRKNVHVLQADVIDHHALKVAADKVSELTGGTLDVLIHSAARMDHTSLYRRLTDYADDNQLDADFTEAFRVNVLGIVHSINAFLPLLRKGGFKKILVMSSGAGDRELAWKARVATSAAYGTTKAAANMVMTKYAVLLESEGFTVFALSPGYVDTTDTAVDQPDEAGKAALDEMLENIRKVYPGYDPAPAPLSLAVKSILMAVQQADPSQNGQYLPAPRLTS